MKIERPRAGAARSPAELPRAVRRPAEPFEGVDGELLRLLGGGDVEARGGPFVPPPASRMDDALPALVALLPSLADEDADARALEALDPTSRALMAPRLAAVRSMAETARTLLVLRAEAEARRRGAREG